LEVVDLLVLVSQVEMVQFLCSIQSHLLVVEVVVVALVEMAALAVVVVLVHQLVL
jgi:hypothetical protein